MNKLDVIQESLNLCKRHICCNRARRFLFPPRKGGGPFIVGQGRMTFLPQQQWYLDVGDGGVLITAQYCPFCGEKLEDYERETNEQSTKSYQL